MEPRSLPDSTRPARSTQSGGGPCISLRRFRATTAVPPVAGAELRPTRKARLVEVSISSTSSAGATQNTAPGWMDRKAPAVCPRRCTLDRLRGSFASAGLAFRPQVESTREEAG
eukprot:scaffold442_cov268-Pinguiococcus_pyrenoidosus.AAC.87